MTRESGHGGLPHDWRPGQPLPPSACTVTPQRSQQRLADDADWVAWDDLCQAVRARGIAGVAQYLCDHPDEAEARIGHTTLRKPMRAEWARLRASMTAISE